MFKVTKSQWSVCGSQKEFICTSADDLAKLPKFGIKGTQVDDSYNYNEHDNESVMYGSIAMVCDGATSEMYILTPDNNWTKI